MVTAFQSEGITLQLSEEAKYQEVILDKKLEQICR